jgi:hypothetical protein
MHPLHFYLPFTLLPILLIFCDLILISFASLFSSLLQGSDAAHIECARWRAGDRGGAPAFYILGRQGAAAWGQHLGHS